jgi:hypothetical protein
VAAGMITGREPGKTATTVSSAAKVVSGGSHITRIEQQSQAGHRAVTVWLETGADTVYRLESRLFQANCRVHALSASEYESHLADVSQALNEAGVIVLIEGSGDAEMRDQVRQRVGADCFLRIDAPAAGETTEETGERLYQRILKEAGVSGSSS